MHQSGTLVCVCNTFYLPHTVVTREWATVRFGSELFFCARSFPLIRFSTQNVGVSSKFLFFFWPTPYLRIAHFRIIDCSLRCGGGDLLAARHSAMLCCFPSIHTPTVDLALLFCARSGTLNRWPGCGDHLAMAIPIYQTIGYGFRISVESHSG